ncbi:ABC transporter ATP-binding protein [uncultured Winogradskyella sp.]|uniref:ABC transporter ATP-binding protein n=1 Tax=uncultured Winogradskyella sp. TaxID=395353 RepID=UPI003519752C
MLKVENITFGYSKSPVLKNITFNVDAGENLAIIGESGSGKSTLLKLIYGEYDLIGGHIFWKDTEILGPKFNLVVGYDFMKQVTQEFDLMPVTTVAENIGKFLSRFYLDKRQERIEELIAVVELEAYSKTKVKYLSGGQKQRVALARALAKEPEILLLDEPFSHIDNFKKHSLRRKVFNYLKKKNISCLVATHDKDDVLGFADQILVLHDKRIIEHGSPKELYDNPKIPLVASFFEEFSDIDNRLYYAHQIQIVKNSNYMARVKQSYFKGRSWLIEAEYKEQTIYIAHHENIAPSTKIFFETIK